MGWTRASAGGLINSPMPLKGQGLTVNVTEEKDLQWAVCGVELCGLQLRRSAEDM